MKRWFIEMWCRVLDWWDKVRGVDSLTQQQDLPPIVYTDDLGRGWTKRPDYNEPWQPDEGQHEVWKREMRIYLYRCVHQQVRADGHYPLAPLGLGQLHIPVGVLNPMNPQLAWMCRRFGFRALAQSAWEGLGLTEESLRAIWEAHEASIQPELNRRHNSCLAIQARWDEAQYGPYEMPNLEAARQSLTTGSYEGDPLPEGRDRAPLAPVKLTPDAVNNPMAYIQAAPKNMAKAGPGRR